MKICVAVVGNIGLESRPFGHFGSAPMFVVCDLESGDLSTINNGDLGHEHGMCQPIKALAGYVVVVVFVQEIMLWIWEKHSELIIESSLSQYLFKMTYHRALNLIAKKEIISRAEAVFYTKNQEMPEDVNYYQIKELTKRIEKAIAALPESYQTAFIMHRFKGMSYKDIAVTYNVSPKTIDYRIQQALILLREDLKDYLPLTVLLALHIG